MGYHLSVHKIPKKSLPFFLLAVMTPIFVGAVPPDAERLLVPGVGPSGIFDPSLETDGARIWMSHSELSPPSSPALPCITIGAPANPNIRIGTRLAFSDDQGDTWTSAGLMNSPTDICTGLSAPFHHGTFTQEVSTLVRDPGAPAGERWKLFWHQYLLINDGVPATEDRRFELGWIGLKAAATPGGLAAAPAQKLYVGSIYDSGADAFIGPPQTALHSLHPDLAGCLTFTEPGAWGGSDGVYLSMACATANGTKIVLLKFTGGVTTYLGTLLGAQAARPFGGEDFQAPDLFSVGGRLFLLATPMTPGQTYLGCRVFEVSHLASAALSRDGNGTPLVFSSLSGTPGFHQGACGYEAAATASGFVFGEASGTQAPEIFRLYKTFHTLTSFNAAAGATLTFPLPATTVSAAIPAGAFPGQTAVAWAGPAALSDAPGSVTPLTGTPAGAVLGFDPGHVPMVPVSVTLSYTAGDVAGLDEDGLILARGDAARGTWAPLVSQVDTILRRVTASTSLFSRFRVMLPGLASSFDGAKAFPNPLRATDGPAMITLTNLIPDAEVKILTPSGATVKSLRANQHGLAVWDTTNDEGRRVASGVYLAFIKGPGQKDKILKIVVQR